MTLQANVNASGDDLPPTEMIYYTYEGNFQLDCDAEILACQFIDDDEKPECENEGEKEVRLSLNRTVLHAQGGGQPTDTGKIRVCSASGDEKTEIFITKVLLDRATNVATHTGTLNIETSKTFASPSSWIGEKAMVSVDANRRQILSECHTAGHVVDMAMAQCKTMMPPTKAYHFLDGPYVEYKGKIPNEERDILLKKLQNTFQELVEFDIATEITTVSRSDAEEICNNMTGGQDYFQLTKMFKEDENVRIVRVAGWPCPCGGTHVKSTGELKKRNWGITGFRCKKGVVRVKYGQDWEKEKK
ncbi:unnamed protein product [Pseudo-nitzschia multistriata]|uniref:Threonyl/alanyl tRNA synthetase SAD domain-containing protein n=1 Tax=Pseudo-nitzschia multistriata TaxID=183589 RepID=A0A448Z836_9STRA|nr:unnamed protein product [Pseudo-nitzschia multistriata]